jgi:hypothetical protein
MERQWADGNQWLPTFHVNWSGALVRKKDGITLMDHPDNPNHPTVFHVRNDGWMGACLTFDGDRVLKQGECLRLRYGLYVHSELLSPPVIDVEWNLFGETEMFEFKK